MKLNQWEQIASVDQLDPDELKAVVELILDRLELTLIREATPDYTAFSLRPNDSAVNIQKQHSEGER